MRNYRRLLQSGVGRRLWRPSDAAGGGPAVWVNAKSPGTVEVDGSNNVVRFLDISGNGFHLEPEVAVSSEVTYDPIGFNGLPTIGFNDSDYGLSRSSVGISGLDGQGEFTYMAAHAFLANQPWHVIMGPRRDNLEPLTGQILTQQLLDREEIGSHNGGRVDTGSTHAIDVTGNLVIPRVSGVRRAGVALDGLNSTLTNLSTAPATGESEEKISTQGFSTLLQSDMRFAIGCKQQVITTAANMLIPEAVAYDYALTNDDWQRLKGYLAHQWGVQDTLADDDPYRYEPPYL